MVAVIKKIINSKFLSKNKDLTFMLGNDYEISGSMTSPNLREALFCSIGEFIERYELFQYISSKSFLENGYIETINLYTNQTKIIENNQNLSRFFYDTCGCASHTNSNNAIYNALMEFIERQSFMLTYLTKSNSKKLDFSKLSLQIIPDKYDFLNFYNISLIDSCFVILALGFKEQKTYISLGASKQLYTAILKSIKEMEQLFFYYRREEKCHLYLCDTQSNNSVNDYFNKFMDLPVEKVKAAYSFLNCYDKIYIEDKDLYLSSNQKDIIQELYDRYRIEPLLCKISNKNRVVKIFDINWFPSINPQTLSKKNKMNIEKITGKVLDGSCTFIPFP
ncbi:YcaO-like family protein [Streptococcus suis]|nr:YcaO-like family protein [Streptococcus suis]